MSLSTSGPGVNVPDTAPLVVALPSVASLVKPDMVALLLNTGLPPMKSKTTNPDIPWIGVVVTLTLNASAGLAGQSQPDSDAVIAATRMPFLTLTSCKNRIYLMPERCAQCTEVSNLWLTRHWREIYQKMSCRLRGYLKEARRDPISLLL